MRIVPSEEIAGRLVTFQAGLKKLGVHAAILRQNTDLYYFTGTVQDGYLIVPAEGQPIFAVRRDVQRAQQQSPLRPILPLGSLKELPGLVEEAVGVPAPRTLGLELDVLPAATFFFFDEKLLPKDHLVDVGGLIRQIRMVKSSWEISMMREAARISHAVAQAVPDLAREGMGEWELMAELQRVALLNGHLGFSRVRAFNLEIFFGHILSGPEAATPSYADAPTGGAGISPAFGQGSGRRSLKRGDLLSVDTMMNHHGYLNDQTRNFSLGAPHPVLRDTYRLCRDLHQWLRENAKPGAVTGELYDSAVALVEKAGKRRHFMGPEDSGVSFLAHGLGLEVDELPFIARGQKMVLQEGMTLAFEPKWAFPGLGIVGYENTYVVTRDGLDSLNITPEDLVVI
ncbi:Xaa-Pro aminopeptidase [Desulfacinum hydrothermale DSM 13146]|uniref:Xaa-Pro aminopeptidase n=1 Tax=Desulfacinum hydrothermale DSM 13146 TaxID=1121390 RepID=A0A1W1X9K6_9BACT|nr:Xaa-Pro peptidase family protein [Desulfacinum hydrothermale]SMC20523.1 Xaa-Pro aminopeptidase [Desulfacinum hydrothermale DSM 13146]